MTKSEQLEKLKKEMETANLPLMESNLVFGEGNIDSPVVFIGEAPGFNENEQRRPFVGRAGQLLNELIKARRCLYYKHSQTPPARQPGPPPRRN